MQNLLRQVVLLARLARVSTAFGVVANAWFVVLWTRSTQPDEGQPGLAYALIMSAAAGVALFAFGAATNDVLDLKRDRALSPERPMAGGELSSDAGIAVLTAALLIAVLAASVFGQAAVVLACISAAALSLFNFAGRFVPAFGLLLLGMIYAAAMVLPASGIAFVWPVWLVMTHAMAVACATHVVGRKIPRVTRRAWAAAAGAWLAASTVLYLIGRARTGHVFAWPAETSPAVGLWISALAVLFVFVVWRKTRALGAGARAAEKVWRYGALWMALYACAWLLGAGYITEAIPIALLALGGFLGMTVLREAYGLIEQPSGFRR